jgi:hypothetical protein
MPLPRFCLFFVTVAFLNSTTSAADPVPTTIDPNRLARIDGVVQAALDRHELPGAVVFILHRVSRRTA